jgi:hypothetical protein
VGTRIARVDFLDFTGPAMQILDAGSIPPRPLLTPAVEPLTAWHRAQLLRQARAALDAVVDDDAAVTSDPAQAPAATPLRPPPPRGPAGIGPEA